MGAVEVIRVVLDTNVLVSGLLFGGTPGLLVELWKTGRILPLMSGEMVNEFLRVLAYPKLQLSEAGIEQLPRSFVFRAAFSNRKTPLLSSTDLCSDAPAPGHPIRPPQSTRFGCGRPRP
jgi:predicted nucleic acid-binding protein